MITSDSAHKARETKFAAQSRGHAPLFSAGNPMQSLPLKAAFDWAVRKNAEMRATFTPRQWLAMNAVSGLLGMATSGFLLIAFEIGSKLGHAQGPVKILAISLCVFCVALSATTAYLTFYALREATSFSRQRAEERREALAARRLQESFQPRSLPSLSGLQFAFTCRMCRDIGGDYYDIIELPGEQILLVIADVSGKGVPAALITSTIHTLVRTFTDQNLGLLELARAIHHHIVRHTDASRYVTAFLAHLNAQERTRSYINAGHNPPLLVSGGQVRELSATSLPLGLPLPMEHAVETVALDPDFALLMYTDGLIERENRQGDQYGSERLVRLFSNLNGSSLDERISQILADNDEFAQSQAAGDDLTLLIAKGTFPAGSP